MAGVVIGYIAFTVLMLIILTAVVVMEGYPLDTLLTISGFFLVPGFIGGVSGYYS